MKLESVPRLLFWGQSQLKRVYFAACINLGRKGLPDDLLRGLTGLEILSFLYCPFVNMPNLDDLKVCVCGNAPAFPRCLREATSPCPWPHRHAVGSTLPLPAPSVAVGLLNLRAGLPLLSLGFGDVPVRQVLKVLFGAGAPATHHPWHMNETENEVKFDGLVAAETLYIQGNQLDRVPGFKNMRSLEFLNVAFNKITKIAPGDFKGATRLVCLSLSGNAIVSVATAAFGNLKALHFTRDEFEPKKADGSPYVNDIGMGLWLRFEKGHFGADTDYAYPPIAFAPNPVKCVWTGPHIADLTCSSCVLGYETTSSTDNTCVKPRFRPFKDWESSDARAELQLQSTQGNMTRVATSSDGESGTPTILRGFEYSIPAPKLEPRERKFVGYQQPYSKIKYEIDFSLGTEVDLACGVDVVGDATHDANTPKSWQGHPWSSQVFMYQFGAGRAQPEADPPYPGYFPVPCPRYHRFSVTKPGNLTFDTCASMMDVGIQLYKKTDNLAESDPMYRYNNGTLVHNQTYTVPLHRNDRVYRNVTTGLKKIQLDWFPQGMVDWMHESFHTNGYPRLVYRQNAEVLANNGCPLSNGAHRTYYLDVGDYFLQTSGLDPSNACSDFTVKMQCSGGAETTSPLDSDPRGFSVDAETGGITGTPQNVRDGYKLVLRAVDAADARTDVATWTFNVKEPPAFSLNLSSGWSDETDGRLANKYHISETHLLPKPRVKKEELLQHPANGDFNKVVYLLSAKRTGGSASCTVEDNSALTDVATGAGAINIECEGNYTGKLVVRDGGGDEVVLRDWSFEVLRRDTAVPEYGPGGKGCANGAAVDGKAMDRKFKCDCNATRFTGKNCQVEPTAAATASDDDDVPLYVIGAVLAVLVLGTIIAVLVVRYQRYQRSMMVTDFQAQLEAMKEEGSVDVEISGDHGPRELKRGWLMFIDKLGHGQFGEVGLTEAYWMPISDGAPPSSRCAPSVYLCP